MEILTQRTFDIFRFIFPGLFVIGTFATIFSTKIELPYDIITIFVDKVQLNQAIFLILFSYIVGIAHDQLCIIIIRFLKLKNSYIPEYKTKNSLSSTEKYALVNHYSPNNLDGIDKWNMLKGMCINISGFLLYFSFCSIIKILNGKPIVAWLVAGIISLICCSLIFIRSKVYLTWATQDLDSTIDSLNLIERGKLIKND